MTYYCERCLSEHESPDFVCTECDGGPMTRKLTPTRLDEIVAAADAATPGPWEVIPATFEEGRRIKTPAYELMAVDIDAPYLDRTDAEHIATMDPATTLALVAEVRELRAKVERVRALHQPAETVDDGGATFDPTPCTCGHWDYTQCPDRRALGEEA